MQPTPWPWRCAISGRPPPKFINPEGVIPMIYYVEGKLALCEKNLAVVDVNGVGFSVSTSMYTIGNIKTGEKVKLYTHL
ncbi:MAG: hypothetical protein IJF34_00800, partial [Clostridia bacterium]|nr:hypothetical protein [Clostridia bacterium]